MSGNVSGDAAETDSQGRPGEATASVLPPGGSGAGRSLRVAPLGFGGWLGCAGVPEGAGLLGALDPGSSAGCRSRGFAAEERAGSAAELPRVAPSLPGSRVQGGSLGPSK